MILRLLFAGAGLILSGSACTLLNTAGIPDQPDQTPLQNSGSSAAGGVSVLVPLKASPSPGASASSTPQASTSPVAADPTDTDADGIADSLEGRIKGDDTKSRDSDADGVPDYRDSDSDNNGLPDQIEVCPPANLLVKLAMPACDGKTPYDFDHDGLPDISDPDNDHDSASANLRTGLEDKFELTGSSLPDTDADGIADLYDSDSDNDFIPDLEDGIQDNDADGVANFRDTDSDGDGVPDACEAHNKVPASAALFAIPVLDTDGDGQPDFLDADSDGDLFKDGIEDRNHDCLVDSNETSRVQAN